MGDFDCCAAKPVPDAQHAAVLAAMREAGCEFSPLMVESHPSGRGFCYTHDRFTDATTPDVCIVIDQAVAIGYSAGRRDALTEAAAAIIEPAYEPRDLLIRESMLSRAVSIALGRAAGRVRSLLTTTKETKP